MVSLSLKQRLLTLRELIANETNSSLLLLQLDHIISNLGGLSKNEMDEVICQMQKKLKIQENKCQALKKSLKLSENSLEKLRYDLEGSSVKSQNLEKDLKGLRQKIFKEKMMQNKEERRIFRKKLEELKLLLRQVQGLICLNKITEAKDKVYFCLDNVQNYKLNKNCVGADYSKQFDEISMNTTLDVSFLSERTLSQPEKRRNSEHAKMFNLCWKNSGCNILQPLDQ